MLTVGSTGQALSRAPRVSERIRFLLSFCLALFLLSLTPSHTLSFFLSSACAVPVAPDSVRVQEGVARTNCKDNLDRTNLVQAFLAIRHVWEQLQDINAYGTLSGTNQEHDWEVTASARSVSLICMFA